MIRRRQFLLGTLAVVAVSGLAVVGFGRMAGEAEIVSLVRRRLSFLRLDDAGLHAFARDQTGALLAKRPTWNRMKYHFLSVLQVVHALEQLERPALAQGAYRGQSGVHVSAVE
jgi:hypothetical protein